MTDATTLEALAVRVATMEGHRTFARVISSAHQCHIVEGDIVYIDGYVRGGDDRPCAVCVRLRDGAFDMLPLPALEAILRAKAEGAE